VVTNPIYELCKTTSGRTGYNQFQAFHLDKENSKPLLKKKSTTPEMIYFKT
jgi:hypothetical protein